MDTPWRVGAPGESVTLCVCACVYACKREREREREGGWGESEGRARREKWLSCYEMHAQCLHSQV